MFNKASFIWLGGALYLALFTLDVRALDSNISSEVRVLDTVVDSLTLIPAQIISLSQPW